MTKFQTDLDGHMMASPIGAHVTMKYEGRRLLGEVIDYRLTEVEGERLRLLTVRHFNGEPWPVKPYFLAVDVLERTP